MKGGHWGIKQELKSSLEDLTTVVKQIQYRLKYQLHELHLFHKSQKAEIMLFHHNAPIFWYLWYEVSTQVIEHMYEQWKKLIKKFTCLSLYIRVFQFTMRFLCKHDIQEFLFAEKALKQDHMHSHWWLNSLIETHSVNSIHLIQDPIWICWCGRLNDAFIRCDLSQWELALNQVHQQKNASVSVKTADTEEAEVKTETNQSVSQQGGCQWRCEECEEQSSALRQWAL